MMKILVMMRHFGEVFSFCGNMSELSDLFIHKNEDF